MAMMMTKSVSAPLYVLSVFFFFLLLGSIAHSATPQSPPPMADCAALVLEMADCLSYVSTGSTDKKPQGSCCSGIKTVLKTNAQCLCFAFRNSAQFGVTLNVTKAMTLPDVCRLSHPPLTNCDLNVNVGAHAPALAPASSLGPTTADGDAAAPSPISGANEVNPTQLPLGGPPSSGSGSGSSGSWLLLILSTMLLFASD